MGPQDYSTYAVSRSQATVFTGDAIPTRGFEGAYITTQWTAGDGAAVGTQAVEGSVDGVNWEALRDSSGTAIAFSSDPDGSGAGTSSVSLADIASRYIRVTATADTPGTGLYSVQVYLS